MKLTAKILAAALVSGAMTSSAMAEGFYAAADFGSISYSGATSARGTGENFANPSAISIGGGYRFGQYSGVILGAEADYSIIGDSKLSSLVNGISSDETLKASALQVAAVATYPVNDQFDVFGKLGFANTTVDYSISASNGVTGSGSNSKINLAFGVGGQYNISKQVGVRVQYVDFGKNSVSSRFSNGNLVTRDIGTTVFSAGVVYNF